MLTYQLTLRFVQIVFFIVLLPIMACKSMSKQAKTVYKTTNNNIPQKAFEFRSMHLDVARHFFPVPLIKQYIDSLAANNFNYFHWHLTDDQGWRIEIKKYPLLTEIGAWRQEKNKATYGGYYSQKEIKDIVAYAQKQGVEIIPEIDMPGHSTAAIAAYPWLGCTGKSIKVPYKHGVYQSVLCPTDTVQAFLKHVFDEVCTLFPGKYVHIGGDEVPKSSWRNFSGIREIMQKSGVKSMRALQNYWMHDLADYLQKKGKVVIVWGEVTRSAFSKDLVIMSWRGKRAGIKAAKQGNKVVMTSRFYCYFDYPQHRTERKPVFYYPYLSNKKVAAYELYAKQLTLTENNNIIGGGGMMWTEFISDTSRLWHQFSPRAATLGKVLSGK